MLGVLKSLMGLSALTHCSITKGNLNSFQSPPEIACVRSQLVCVAGVLKSLVGLSASVYTSMYVAAFRPDALSFLLLIAVAPTALGLCAMPLFNALPEAAAGTEDENAKATGAAPRECPQHVLY